MPSRWTPRKALFRRFKQIKGHLEEALQYLEDIKQPHEGRPEEKDLVVFLTVVQNRVAEIDMLVDAAHHRFKTGKFPEVDDVEPTADLQDSDQGDPVGSPVRPEQA